MSSYHFLYFGGSKLCFCYLLMWCFLCQSSCYRLTLFSASIFPSLCVTPPLFHIPLILTTSSSNPALLYIYCSKANSILSFLLSPPNNSPNFYSSCILHSSSLRVVPCFSIPIRPFYLSVSWLPSFPVYLSLPISKMPV